MSNSSFKIKHGLNVSGNVVVTGNIDGRDLVIDGNKLDNIEVGATADQSATSIKQTYNRLRQKENEFCHRKILK
jgi:predicted Ser/Thr protein kinase